MALSWLRNERMKMTRVRVTTAVCTMLLSATGSVMSKRVVPAESPSGSTYRIFLTSSPLHGKRRGADHSETASKVEEGGQSQAPRSGGRTWESFFPPVMLALSHERVSPLARKASTPRLANAKGNPNVSERYPLAKPRTDPPTV